MMLKRWTHGFHRYAGLIISLQILLWSLTGFLMSFWSFGDLYTDPPPVVIQWDKVSLSAAELQSQLLAQGIQVARIELVMLGGEPVYRAYSLKGDVSLWSQSAQLLDNPLPSPLVRQVAQHQYLGAGQLVTLELLPTSSGNYFSSTPVYRATFDDEQQTEVYLDPRSGKLLARRKALWAWYNRMWEFHLMKYTSHGPTNKYLLWLSAGVSFLVSVTGIFKFFRW